MSIISGGYQVKAGTGIHDKAKAIAHASARIDGLLTKCLVATNRVSLYLVERQGGRVGDFTTAEQRRTQWVLGDVNYVDCEHIPKIKKHLGHPVDHRVIPGRWVIAEHDAIADELSLTTDRWGLLWLYLARTADGFLFSSDFGSLISHLDSRPSLNPASCVMELALGYCLGDETIYDSVTLAPPGSRLTFSEGKLHHVQVVPPVYTDDAARMSTKQQLERLDELWYQTELHYFRPFSKHLMVSISGGVDSRHALAVLNRRKIPAKYLTFGDPGSEEVRNASLICGRVGVHNDVFSFQDARWDEWARCIVQLGNAGIVQWTGWADQFHRYLQAFGSALVTGIFGGPLSGTHLIPSADRTQDWVKNWTRYSVSMNWTGLLRPQWVSWLSGQLEDRFRSQLAGLTFAMPHQKAIHLDYYERQRRWTAAQPELISRFLTPVPYLYSDGFIAFWSSLDFKDLRGQRLYLTYARSRFPELFPPWERRPGLVWRIVRRARAEVLRRRAPARSEEVAAPVIDHRQILKGKEAHIRRLVETVRDSADLILDCDALVAQVEDCIAGRRSNGQQLVRCVNLLHLLSVRC